MKDHQIIEDWVSLDQMSNESEGKEPVDLHYKGFSKFQTMPR